MSLTASSYIQTNHLAGKTRWLVQHSAACPTFAANDRAASMDEANATEKKGRKKMKKAPEPSETAATADRKRRRRVLRTNPKCKREEEVPRVADIEDFNFTTDETLEIRASLLEWYDRNRRDLPWRRISSSDEEESEKRAYAVWVSEVMLQQTRVQTVIDYFNRWMQKWPTLHHLARASLEEVNEMWAGLGYYRRARYLLEGAKMIVEEGSEFPKTVSALRKVRGIGDYTAGAIASIAFKEAVPLVDGNVVRVVARLKVISANPKHSATVKSFWKLAGQLVDPSRSGDFNQALMELGATICTPLDPTCAVCPVSSQCRALSLSKQHRSALVTDYPTRVVKPKQRHEFSAVSVVEILEGQDLMGESQSVGRYLLIKRPDEGLLAGLWEFPSILLEGEANLAMRRDAIDQFLKKSFSLDLKKSCTIVLREDIGEYVHIFSHIRLRMYVELLVLCVKGGMHVLRENTDSNTMIWKSVDSKALSNMGLTSGVRKVYSMVQKFMQNYSKSTSTLGKARRRMS